jgi:hypothetical protein
MTKARMKLFLALSHKKTTSYLESYVLTPKNVQAGRDKAAGLESERLKR